MRKTTIAVASVVLALAALATAMTAGAESSEGTFVVKCTPSHLRSADPIVSPGVYPSAHEHQFFGNTSTNENSSYASMVAAGTTCSLKADTAGYWAPSLKRADGSTVAPRFSFAYYKTKPTSYRSTVPFPADFRMVAGGLANPSKTFWDCFSGPPSGSFSSPPYCSSGDLQVRLQFPNCWDGVHSDSPDHRSHVVYPSGSGCPADHPVKLPFINFFVRYPPGNGGAGVHFSDGTTVMHADFWNTWNQAALVAEVQKCLNAGINCGVVKG